MKDLLFAPVDPLPEFNFGPEPKVSVPADTLIEDLARPAPAPAANAVPDKTPEEVERIVADVMRAIVEDRESALRAPAVLFQDFQVRCRMADLARPPVDLSAFVRRLSCARAGIFDLTDPDWTAALEVASALPDDMLGAFLVVARAARDGDPCPSDLRIAEVYGTSSLGRVRRLLANIESRELFVCRVDMGGKRSITVPKLGWTTQPAEAA